MAFYQEEERAKLGRKLSEEAIALATQGRWEEAVVVNKNIIEKFPTDIEAYNRLGRALSELGDFVQAREAYLKALELAPQNAIAKKNLARLDSLCDSTTISNEGYQNAFPLRAQGQKLAPGLFITETAKTGVVNLCNLASSEVLARLGLGDQVQLSVERQRLIVISESGEYLGEVELKHAARLIKLIEGGNKYIAAVFTAGENEVQILIREVYQHPSQVGYPSFPTKENLLKQVITSEGEAMEEMEYPEEKFSLGDFSILPSTQDPEEEFEE